MKRKTLLDVLIRQLSKPQDPENSITIDQKEYQELKDQAKRYEQQRKQADTIRKRGERLENDLQQVKEQNKDIREQIRKERDARETQASEQQESLQQITSLQQQLKQERQLGEQLQRKLEEQQQLLKVQQQKEDVLQQQHRDTKAELRVVKQLLMDALRSSSEASNIESRLEHILQETRNALLQNDHGQTPKGTHSLSTSESTQDVLEKKSVSVPVTHWENAVFGRMAHGGVLQTEAGAFYRITELMVQQYDLEHEAQVRIQLDANRIVDIKLLFQGDDTLSPILQLTGTIQLGESYQWYCLSTEDPQQRYPIHYKDIEVLTLTEGIPCFFNIDTSESEFSRYARISRLFTELPEENRPTKNKKKPVANLAKRKNKPSPFLEGYTVAVVGGMKKWVEQTVTDTGAEFIHDDEKQIKRITAALTKVDAVFLLLTATSHESTWQAIEIVKEAGIPHFRIEGSKSNLRQLLIDNQERIRQAREDRNL
ncbi:NmrA family NAD(P)-binding protein [Paenibacillus bovis]|uniref:Uncharacterized protein n=1 Tax=Paenibacillus bovis TaxID=1616788 RepID=A0A1X9T420_9BACL|nr:NmrA family NAD(P)-binding protein [Paenibacillus bovis]ARR10671.1 hypothetical protein AR543_p0063 [Paenibacillus bovis]